MALNDVYKDKRAIGTLNGAPKDTRVNHIEPLPMTTLNMDKFAENCKKMREGYRADAGKEPYDLLPPELLEGVAKILGFGAKKYEARNWEKGMSWGRCFASCMRHLWAWWAGQDKDPESGMSHLWHAGCNIAFLIAYEARKVGTDDRPSTRENIISEGGNIEHLDSPGALSPELAEKKKFTGGYSMKPENDIYYDHG